MADKAEVRVRRRKPLTRRHKFFASFWTVLYTYAGVVTMYNVATNQQGAIDLMIVAGALLISVVTISKVYWVESRWSAWEKLEKDGNGNKDL